MNKTSNNLYKCSNVPSKGGIPRADVKMLAKEMGIETKGLLKAQICTKIIEKSGNSISSASIANQLLDVERKIVHPVINSTAVGRKSGTTNLQIRKQKENMIPYRLARNLYSNQIDIDIGHLSDDALANLLLDMLPEDTQRLCKLSDRINAICKKHKII